MSNILYTNSVCKWAAKALEARPTALQNDTTPILLLLFCSKYLWLHHLERVLLKNESRQRMAITLECFEWSQDKYCSISNYLCVTAYGFMDKKPLKIETAIFFLSKVLYKKVFLLIYLFSIIQNKYFNNNLSNHIFVKLFIFYKNYTKICTKFKTFFSAVFISF